MADGSALALPGLVPSKTSPKRVVGAVTKERSHQARLRRMRRTVLNASRSMVRQRRGFRDVWKMATLTYAPGAEWGPKHVSRFLDLLSKWCQRKRLAYAYVWVLELTQRGVPHYHVLIRVPMGTMVPKPDEMGWWEHGSTRIEHARNAVGYIAKYASKGCDVTQLPKGARISGNAGLDADGRLYVQFWNLPVWCREQLQTVERTKRITGGFVVLSSGEYLPTPYECIPVAGAILIVRKELQQ